jgi:DNA-binding LacI/PurR family transcriptional regulator
MLEQGLPRAVFATNDQLALGVIKELTSRGIDIPGSVAVMGYGNSPSLKTHRFPSQALSNQKLSSGGQRWR